MSAYLQLCHSLTITCFVSDSIQSQTLVEVSGDSVFTQLTRSSDETEVVISLQSSNEFTPCQVLKSVSYWMCVAVVCVHQFMLVVVQNYYKVGLVSCCNVRQFYAIRKRYTRLRPQIKVTPRTLPPEQIRTGTK